MAGGLSTIPDSPNVQIFCVAYLAFMVSSNQGGRPIEDFPGVWGEGATTAHINLLLREAYTWESISHSKEKISAECPEYIL